MYLIIFIKETQEGYIKKIITKTQGTAKAVLSGKFMVINAYIKEKRKNNLARYLKKLEK